MECVRDRLSEQGKIAGAESLTPSAGDDEIVKNEPPITAGELLGEIAPLIEEYFFGEVRFDGKEIIYRLPNGQGFRVSAESE